MNPNSTSFHIVRESFDAANEAESRRKAISSPNTAAVAAAATSGLAVHDFSRMVEDTPTGPKTVVAWHLEEGMVEFRPNFRAEKISTGELLRRFRDEEWQRANPDHPISYMAQHAAATRRLVQCARDKAPLIAFRKGKSTAFLTLGGDRARQERLLTRAGFSPDEISTILSHVHP